MASNRSTKRTAREMLSSHSSFRSGFGEVLTAQSKISSSILRRQTLDIERFEPDRVTADAFIDVHHRAICANLQNNEREMEEGGLIDRDDTSESSERRSNTSTPGSLLQNEGMDNHSNPIKTATFEEFVLSFEESLNQSTDSHSDARGVLPSGARAVVRIVRPPPLVEPHNSSDQHQPTTSASTTRKEPIGRRPQTAGQGGGKGLKAQTGKVVKRTRNNGKLSIQPVKKARVDDPDYQPSETSTAESDTSLSTAGLGAPERPPFQYHVVHLGHDHMALDIGSDVESEEEEASDQDTSDDESVDDNLFGVESIDTTRFSDYVKSVDGGGYIEDDSADDDFEMDIADDDPRVPVYLSRRSKFHQAMVDQDMSVFARIKRKNPAESGCYLTLGNPPNPFMLSHKLQEAAGIVAKEVFDSYKIKNPDESYGFDDARHSREAKFREKEKTVEANFEPYRLSAETVAATESMYKYVQFVITAILRTSSVGTLFYEELMNTTAKMNVSRMLRSQVEPYRTILIAGFNFASGCRINKMTPVEERVVVYEALMKLKQSQRSRIESNKTDEDGVKKEAKRRRRKKEELDAIDF